jgi:hypothetical protein
MVTEVKNYEYLYHEQITKIALLTTENSRLKEQLEWLKRQMFGQKSERFIDTPTKEELLIGFEMPAATQEISTTLISSHTRKVTKAGKNQFKVEIPEDLPREIEYKDIPEEKKIDPKTGISLVKIGEEVRNCPKIS